MTYNDQMWPEIGSKCVMRLPVCIFSLSSLLTPSYASKDTRYSATSLLLSIHSLSCHLLDGTLRCLQSPTQKPLPLDENTATTQDKLRTTPMTILKHIMTYLPQPTNITSKRGNTLDRETRRAGRSFGHAPLRLYHELTSVHRHGEAASTLTSQTMTQFDNQPKNNLQALDDRVKEYRKLSPAPCEHKKRPEEQQRQMADSMKVWSDEWKRLEHQ
jgi:hypothetical protein